MFDNNFLEQKYHSRRTMSRINYFFFEKTIYFVVIICSQGTYGDKKVTDATKLGHGNRVKKT